MKCKELSKPKCCCDIDPNLNFECSNITPYQPIRSVYFYSKTKAVLDENDNYLGQGHLKDGVLTITKES